MAESETDVMETANAVNADESGNKWKGYPLRRGNQYAKMKGDLNISHANAQLNHVRTFLQRNNTTQEVK